MVVDLAMPEQDGYAFLAQAHARIGPVPALAFSAHSGAVEEARARAAGFERFLSKPIDLAKLRVVLSTPSQAPLSQNSRDFC